MLSKDAITLSDAVSLRLVEYSDGNLYFWKVSGVSTHASKCHIFLQDLSIISEINVSL